MDTKTVVLIELEGSQIVQFFLGGQRGDVPQFYFTCSRILGAFPGTYQQVADKTGFSLSTVTQSIHALQRSGAISLSYDSLPSGSAGGRPTHYVYVSFL